MPDKRPHPQPRMAIGEHPRRDRICGKRVISSSQFSVFIKQYYILELSTDYCLLKTPKSDRAPAVERNIPDGRNAGSSGQAVGGTQQ